MLCNFDWYTFIWQGRTFFANLTTVVKSITYWNYYEEFGAGNSESRLLHWYCLIKLLTGIKLKVLLMMQTGIMDSTLAVSRSFGAIPQLSCWPEHKQLCGTNPTETNTRSWQNFPSTYHMNSKPKHFLLKISQVSCISNRMWCYFFPLTIVEYSKQGSKVF